MEDMTERNDVNNDLQNSEEAAEACDKNETPSEAPSKAPTDYAELVREDVRILSEEFSELSELRDICELEDPIRYGALRDLGLSPAEAYLATTRSRAKFDNRSHLHSSPMVSSRSSGYIPEADMEAARELFSDLTDSQIRCLYKKVTK